MNEFWSMFGVGLLVLSLCLGIGGCTYLIRIGDANIIEAKAELARVTQVEKEISE